MLQVRCLTLTFWLLPEPSPSFSLYLSGIIIHQLFLKGISMSEVKYTPAATFDRGHRQRSPERRASQVVSSTESILFPSGAAAAPCLPLRCSFWSVAGLREFLRVLAACSSRSLLASVMLAQPRHVSQYSWSAVYKSPWPAILWDGFSAASESSSWVAFRSFCPLRDVSPNVSLFIHVVSELMQHGSMYNTFQNRQGKDFTSW